MEYNAYILLDVFQLHSKLLLSLSYCLYTLCIIFNKDLVLNILFFLGMVHVLNIIFACHEFNTLCIKYCLITVNFFSSQK